MSAKGAGSIGVDVEIDRAEFKALGKKLDPTAMRNVLQRVAIDATHIALAAAMEATPGSGVGPTGIQRTGHARRSKTADARKHEVYARYPYFNWLDKGTDSRGRQMLSRPDGYQITRQTREKVEAAIPALFTKAGREVAERWSK